MPCVGCANPNKIDLIEGKDIGFYPSKDYSPPGDYIWFTQSGWDKMGTAQIGNIKKKVAP